MFYTASNNKVFNIWLHVLVWLGLLAFPLLLIQSDNVFNIRILNHIWLSVIMSMMIFYLNYFVLIHNLAFKKRLFAFIIINVTVFILLSIFSEYLHQLTSPPSPKKKPPLSLKNFSYYGLYFYREYTVYSLVTGIAIAVRIGKRLTHSEAERKRLETENLKSENSLLKYQIQPHFFFNTLNNIYALVGKSPEEGQKAIHRLSKMMRYIIYENNTEHVPLEKEIEFLENYNRLMQLRLTPSTKVTTSYPKESHGIEVPPLMFISLLENAYKHGVSNTEASFIENTMEIKNGKLVFTVSNSIHRQDINEDKSVSGIGISNITKRLEIIYAKNYSLTFTEQNDIFTMRLEIPNEQKKLSR